MILKKLLTIHDSHKSPKEFNDSYFHIFKKCFSIIDSVTKINDKIFVNILDISFPSNEFFINENLIFNKLVDSLCSYSERQNLSLKYFWIRAYSQSNSIDNYHLFLFCNGHKISNTREIIDYSNKLWIKLLKTNIENLISSSLGENGIILDRNSPDFIEKIEQCIFRVSYFAKRRSKNILPSKIREFGSSRV